MLGQFGFGVMEGCLWVIEHMFPLRQRIYIVSMALWLLLVSLVAGDVCCVSPCVHVYDCLWDSQKRMEKIKRGLG
ncbi:hypothetical protein K458DRAFT_188635 [Lentithecium fluviatile CBS 122367]|uniref:Uncharacterized protein n=1 Tax=Lentithecium fluviatile CBS 122367 TaxID=1168545 RepID=A0A6G1JAP7_9PLEO|nr:hypothetical protein K458DRAFT_188635 [Lentithecium fluviatile CBS 122367]